MDPEGPAFPSAAASAARRLLYLLVGLRSLDVSWMLRLRMTFRELLTRSCPSVAVKAVSKMVGSGAGLPSWLQGGEAGTGWKFRVACQCVALCRCCCVGRGVLSSRQQCPLR